MLHENFADITHVAVVHPEISPPVLRSAPPPLTVTVSETTVRFERDYPPAPLPDYHAAALGVGADHTYPQHEEGAFISPGLWVDRWDVELAGSSTATFRFTHALAPVEPNVTRHFWRVSRNFATDDETTERLHPIFTEYYRRVKDILEVMQTVVDTDGPRREVAVGADAAVIAVRRILRRMVADEVG